MKIAVLGSGNIGTLISAQLTLKGHEVYLYSRKPHLFSSEVIYEDTDTQTKQSVSIHMVTNDLAKAVKDASLVIVSIPSFAIKELMEKVWIGYTILDS